MARQPDDERIRQKAHELWEADGRRHGRDHDHWVQAKEIIAIEDSQADTLLPRDTGAEEPIEDADEALRNLADFPNLTDQGENLMTSVDREPVFASGGRVPSVEVPTSDQPGIPAKSKRATTKPDPDMKASPKNDAPPPGKASVAAGKPASPKKPAATAAAKTAAPPTKPAQAPAKPVQTPAKPTDGKPSKPKKA